MDRKDISYPPVVKEWAYYDDRCPYYRMVNIMERMREFIWMCVSSKKIYNDTRYIKRHGTIRSILSEKLRKRGTYIKDINELVYYH